MITTTYRRFIDRLLALGILPPARDADNRLRLVNPDFGPHSMEPHCPCCTYTVNGIRLTSS